MTSGGISLRTTRGCASLCWQKGAPERLALTHGHGLSAVLWGDRGCTGHSLPSRGPRAGLGVHRSLLRTGVSSCFGREQLGAGRRPVPRARAAGRGQPSAHSMTEGPLGAPADGAAGPHVVTSSVADELSGTSSDRARRGLGGLAQPSAACRALGAVPGRGPSTACPCVGLSPGTPVGAAPPARPLRRSRGGSDILSRRCSGQATARGTVRRPCCKAHQPTFTWSTRVAHGRDRHQNPAAVQDRGRGDGSRPRWWPSDGRLGSSCRWPLQTNGPFLGTRGPHGSVRSSDFPAVCSLTWRRGRDLRDRGTEGTGAFAPEFKTFAPRARSDL